MFIAAQFTIAKRRKQPKYPSTDEWVGKQNTAYPQNGIIIPL